jgi:hypothetical protein
MKIEKGKLYAVITGDIVSFSKLPTEKRQTLSRIIKNGSETLRKTFKGSVPLESELAGLLWKRRSRSSKNSFHRL